MDEAPNESPAADAIKRANRLIHVRKYSEAYTIIEDAMKQWPDDAIVWHSALNFLNTYIDPAQPAPLPNIARQALSRHPRSEKVVVAVMRAAEHLHDPELLRLSMDMLKAHHSGNHRVLICALLVVARFKQDEQFLSLMDSALRLPEGVDNRELLKAGVKMAFQAKQPVRVEFYTDKLLDSLGDKPDVGEGLYVVKTYLALGKPEKAVSVIGGMLMEHGKEFEAQGYISDNRQKTLMSLMRWFHTMACHNIGRNEYTLLYNVVAQLPDLLTKSQLKELNPNTLDRKQRDPQELLAQCVRELFDESERAPAGAVRGAVFRAIGTYGDQVAPIDKQAGMGIKGRKSGGFEK